VRSTRRALACWSRSSPGPDSWGPESGRIGKLGEERGPTDPEVQRRIGRILVISRIEFVLLVLIVLVMVLKPGL
jgi:hypothetical protein